MVLTKHIQDCGIKKNFTSPWEYSQHILLLSKNVQES